MSKRTTMTRVQFFKLCEFIRDNAEHFLKEQPSQRDAADYVSKALGFPVSRHVIEEAKNITGIKWECKKPQRDNGKEGVKRVRLLRQMSKAIVILYRQLGIAPPQEFLDTVQSLYGNDNHLPSIFKPDGDTVQNPFPSQS